MKNSARSGWVRIYRCINDNELYLSEPFTKAQAWIDMVLFANFTEGIMWVRGNKTIIKRGQLGWSEVTMASRWKWSRNKVRRFLQYLEKTAQQITQHKSHITSVITILNYEKYQSDGTTDDTTDDTRYKKDKNVKNTLLIQKSAISPPLKDSDPLKLAPKNMQHYDENKMSDDHEKVIDYNTDEVSTVGKSERINKVRTELNARFKRFYPFLIGCLKKASGNDIELPTIPQARREFNRVSKYTDQQIADIVKLFCSTDTAKEHPTVHAALSVSSINNWIIKNRKSDYFK